MMPPRWIRKIFKIKKKKVPFFALFDLYASIAFLVLIPVEFVFCIVSGFDVMVSLLSLCIPVAIGFVIVVGTLVLRGIFNKTDTEQRKKGK